MSGNVLNLGGPLLASDFEKLERSAIPRELAEQALLRRVASLDGGAVIGRNGKGDYAGVVYPNVFPGDAQPREYRLRLDNPPLEQLADGSIKESHKYLSPPGSRSTFYFPPGVGKEWLSDTSLDIILTEGEKKALALHALALQRDPNAPRFLAIGLAGVWNFRGIVGKTVGPNGERRDVKGAIADFARVAWPGRRVVIAFDSDVASNESVRYARQALAREVRTRGARSYFLDVPPGEDGQKQGVDDWIVRNGHSAVLDAIDWAFKRQEATACKEFELIDNALFYRGANEEDRVFICSRLEVRAYTRNGENNDWGRLLCWYDPDGNEHIWSMPAELLAGDGSEYRQHLYAGGLDVSSGKKARDYLSTYIKSSKPTQRVRVVDRLGWYQDKYDRFVLPDKTIGISAEPEDLLFQSVSSVPHAFHTAGRLCDWTDSVGTYCLNNSRLILAVSCAFSGPLLPLTGEGGGGFHFRGGSSTGKTTALVVAGSVWGGGGKDGYVRSWRGTVNGIEAIAELHNHGLLCLDELGQVDPRQAGDCAYLLANGLSKNRMGKAGGVRKQTGWRLNFLSSGELKLSDHAGAAGGRIRGGQDVRMCDIEADAGAGKGLFENIHGDKDPAAFSKSLRSAATKFYGTPITEFLSQLTSDLENSRRQIETWRRRFEEAALKKKGNVSGEVQRIASRFSLVAAAGELASSFGITPWTDGHATEAARKCFQAWLADRGTVGAYDLEQAVRQVRLLIEKYPSRFQSVGDTGAADASEKFFERLGYKRIGGDGIEFLFTTETFRAEVCKGFDAGDVAGELAKRGLLKTDGRAHTVKRTLPDHPDKVRVYCVSGSILHGDRDE